MAAAAASRFRPRGDGSHAGRGHRRRPGRAERSDAVRLGRSAVRARPAGRHPFAGRRRRQQAAGAAGLDGRAAAGRRGAGPVARGGASVADWHGQPAQDGQQEPGLSGQVRAQGTLCGVAGSSRRAGRLGAPPERRARHPGTALH
ncbi:hypothetical protein G6F22_018429 [Rhizopus arrhizus]|nr:hypothetical protein G6F22_018429 [Rhizopus arrhizus]